MVSQIKRGFSFRVLVVDDDASVRELSQMVLKSEGYEVITAQDGFDALQSLKLALPNLIISDLSMPGMSGFEFLSVIRRRFLMFPSLRSVERSMDNGLLVCCVTLFSQRPTTRLKNCLGKWRS